MSSILRFWTDWVGPNLVTWARIKARFVCVACQYTLRMVWTLETRTGLWLPSQYSLLFPSEAADDDFLYPGQTERVWPSPFEHALSFQLHSLSTDIPKGDMRLRPRFGLHPVLPFSLFLLPEVVDGNFWESISAKRWYWNLKSERKLQHRRPTTA